MDLNQIHTENNELETKRHVSIMSMQFANPIMHTKRFSAHFCHRCAGFDSNTLLIFRTFEIVK